MTVKDIKDIYQQLCREHELDCPVIESVRSYDDSTLFCPAGMQQFKAEFLDPHCKQKTVANIQRCMRLNELDDEDDGYHGLVFDMIGLFSFRDWTVAQTITFFHEFLRRCGIEPDYVTVHPDRWYWQELHPAGTTVKPDKSCQWQLDGVAGYCTEFFVEDKDGVIVELGNIVNPMGDCIDVGFGLDRISALVNNCEQSPGNYRLEYAISTLLASGVKPSNTKQGYILRKLFRRLFRASGYVACPEYFTEKQRWEDTVARYKELLPKNQFQTPEWWWDTHGIKIGVDVEINPRLL